MSDSEIQRSLGRIEGALDAQKDAISSINSNIEALEGRVSSLETKGAAAGGVAGFLVSVVTSVVAFNLRGIGIQS